MFYVIRCNLLYILQCNDRDAWGVADVLTQDCGLLEADGQTKLPVTRSGVSPGYSVAGLGGKDRVGHTKVVVGAKLQQPLSRSVCQHQSGRCCVARSCGQLPHEQ